MVRLFLSGGYDFLCRMYGLNGASGMVFHPFVVLMYKICKMLI